MLINNPSHNRQIFDILLLITISIVTYYASLHIYFLSENVGHIQRAWYFLTDTEYYYYRPVWALTLIMDHFFWGMNPIGYHATNLILHTANSVLVYYLSRQLLSNRDFSIASALIFLLHPIHSLNIFWISGRTDMVCMFFFMISLIWFIKYQRNAHPKWMYLSLSAFVLALFSKEMALSLPLLIVLYLGLLGKADVKKTVRLFSIYFVFAILFLGLKYFLNPDVLSNAVHSNLSPVHLLKNAASYAGLLLIPAGHIEIGLFLKANPIVFIALSLLLLLTMIGFIWLVKNSRQALFFLFFILLTLLPVMRLMMRWYLYIPSIGFSMLLGWLLFEKMKNRRVGLMLLAGISITLAIFSIQEEKRWLNAGALSEELSLEYAEKIAVGNIQNCAILAVPAELEETPVFMFGFKELIKFRLETELAYKQVNEILAIAKISLAQKSDLAKVKIIKQGEQDYTISLQGTASCFTFPNQTGLVSGTARAENGGRIEVEGAQIDFLDTDSASRVKAIRIHFPPDFPVLIY